MTPDPLSGFQEIAMLRLGSRKRAKRTHAPYIEQNRRPPKDHRFCPQHPERYIPSVRRGSRCWLCETKDESAFDALDLLIQLGLGDRPQCRITEEMVEQASMAQHRLKKDAQSSVRETQERP